MGASTVVITLAGVDVRTRVAGLTIRDVLNDAPNSCTLTIDGTEAPQCEQTLRVALDPAAPRLLFNGALQTVGLSYEGLPAHVCYPSTAIDDTARANRRRPFGSWVAVSATTFAQQLLAQFAPGFTTTHVQAGLPPVTILLDGTEGLSGALALAAKQIGGYFYFEDGDLHLFLEEATEAPDAIDGSPGRLLDDPPIAITRDDSQLRTRQCGRAHGEALLADVLATETILPVENAAAWFGTVPPGGRAVALAQRLAYTGVQAPVGGSLVGPGAAPGVAPNLTPLAASGALAPGVYKYAYTHRTAAGESIPSPVTAITVAALMAPPTGSIGITLLASPDGVDPGFHQYAISFINNTGETTPGALNSVTTDATHRDVRLVVPVGPVGTLARNIWRTTAGGSQFKLLRRLNDNTQTTPADQTHDADLGVNAPTTNTATTTGVTVSGIGLGGGATTSRRLYRTAVNGAQLKLLATIADNVTTTVADTTPDGGLGANAPTGDTSGLTQPSGQVNPGSPTLLTASAGPFASSGWAIVGNNRLIRYTSLAGNTLSGIPASGSGAIQTPIIYGTQILPAPALTGVTGLTAPLAKDTLINVWVQRDDLAAQAEQAAVDAANGLVPADGIYEGPILVDERRNEASMVALCDAQLLQFARPIVTVTYACRDVKTKSGKTVLFDLSPYADAIRRDGPTAYWRFAEGAGAPVFADASGHGHDAAAHPVTTSGYVLNGALGIGATGATVRSGTGRFTVNHAATIGGVTVHLAGASGTDPETHLDFADPLTAAIADGAPIVELFGIAAGVPGALGDGSTGIATDTAVITHAPIAFALPGTAGALELWLRPRDVAVDDYAGIVQDGVNGFGLWLQHPAGAGLQVAWYDALASGWVNTPLVPGALYHLVVTVDAAGALTWFVNGVRATDVTPSADPVQGVLLDTIAGVSYVPSNAGLAADLLDELAIYPYALTAAQVAAHYALRGQVWALAGAYTIQEVTISEIDSAPGLLPRYTVTASSTRFSLDDILRRLLRAADASATYSG